MIQRPRNLPTGPQDQKQGRQPDRIRQGGTASKTGQCTEDRATTEDRTAGRKKKTARDRGVVTAGQVWSQIVVLITGPLSWWSHYY